MHAPDDYALLEPWAETWQHWAADAFLKGYTAAIEHAPPLPRDEAGRHLLLSAFILDKALYELEDELNDRSDRVRIPLIGIRKLIGALSAPRFSRLNVTQLVNCLHSGRNRRRTSAILNRFKTSVVERTN